MKKRIAIIVILLSIVSSQIAIADSGVVTTASLRVRQTPSLLSNITGYLLKNAKINTLAKSGDFYKINFNGKPSYVSTLYVKLTSGTSITSTIPTATPTDVGNIIASDFLNVRKTASLDNNVIIIGSLKPNQKIDIYGLENDFYKIKYSGQWGYIYKTYVSLVNATSNSAQYVANGQQSITTATGNNIVSYANTFLGTPYLWGGATPAKLDSTGKYISGGFDCSGLVLYVYKHYGITLPRTTMDQINIGLAISIDNLKNGDLVFFNTDTSSPSKVSHVGIYIGNNKFIHCPKPGDVVKISELTGYYKENFVIGKRIIK